MHVTVSQMVVTFLTGANAEVKIKNKWSLKDILRKMLSNVFTVNLKPTVIHRLRPWSVQTFNNFFKYPNNTVVHTVVALIKATPSTH